MVYTDPYTPSGSYYECHDCRHRGSVPHTPGSCPECGGLVSNIAVARE